MEYLYFLLECAMEMEAVCEEIFPLFNFFLVHGEKDGVKKGESGEMKCWND